MPNCYRQVRERSSFRVQGQRMWHPFLTCGLLYRRPTFSRARFDVEVVRERNFRFEIVRDRLTRFGRISKALVITTVCDFPSCFPIPVRGGKLETRDTSRYKRRELDFIVSDLDSKTILGF